jgi:hypothetical protein
MRKPSRAFLVTVALLLVVGAWMIIQSSRPAGARRSYISCRSNLSRIEGAKVTWAEANQKKFGDETDEAAVLNIMGNGRPARLVCPDGGSYAFGRVGEPTSCSSSRIK